MANKTGSGSMKRGEDVSLDYTLNPVEDCTGWTIAWGMAAYPGGTLVVSKTAVVTDGPGGAFSVSLASADTASLAAGTYAYEARRTDTGSRNSLADGTLDLKREVVP